MLKHVEGADVAAEIEPIHESRLGDPPWKHGLDGDSRNIPHEEEDDCHDDSQAEVTLGEEAVFPDAGLLPAVAATEHVAVCLHRHPDLAAPHATGVAILGLPQQTLAPHPADGGNIVPQMVEELKHVHL